MKTKFLLAAIANLIIALSSLGQVTGTFTDPRDGKIYKTVKIGTQTWMAENLAFKANSGCWAYNNDQKNVATYGYLYNWETAKKVCPNGWHLPSNGALATLTVFLGGEEVAGGKLKSTSTWASPNTGATNKSGFTALPSGSGCDIYPFEQIETSCWLWSSTEYNTGSAWILLLGNESNKVYIIGCKKDSGCSVRCLKN